MTPGTVLKDLNAYDDQLDFQELQKALQERQKFLPEGIEEWNLADWSNEMCGEAGEAANIVKKLRRLETGITTQPADLTETKEGMAILALNEVTLLGKLQEEIADVIITALNLANYIGNKNMVPIIRKKFTTSSTKLQVKDTLNHD